MWKICNDGRGGLGFATITIQMVGDFGISFHADRRIEEMRRANIIQLVHGPGRAYEEGALHATQSTGTFS